MPNSYFAFKQFRVEQEDCAMKVSTDACIQGAWLATQWQHEAPAQILDIGAGTGLLSLMLAQELAQSEVTAIEVNAGAARQALHNCRHSPWSDRIHVVETAIQQFESALQYEAIICNPPFFHQHLESTDADRRQARHSDSLDKETLAGHIAALLQPSGSAGILYPASEWEAWVRIAARHGLYLHRLLTVRPHERKEPNRMIGLFKPVSVAQVDMEELCIYQAGTRQYTPAFIQLMFPYYLQL